MKILLSSLLLCLATSYGYSQDQSEQKKSYLDSLATEFRYDKMIDHLLEQTSITIKEKQILADAQYRAGRFYDALSTYEELYELDSNYIFQLQKARILDKIGEERQASFWYYQIANREVDNVYLWKLAAKSATKLADFNLAMRCYSIAIELQDQDLEIISDYARLLMKMEFYETADSLLVRGIELSPNANFLKSQRLILLYRTKQYEEMVELADAFFKEQDSSEHLSKNYFLNQKLAGLANYHVGNFKQCKKLLSSVIEIETDSDLLHYYLGLAHRELGDLETAIEHIEKSIDLAVSDNLPNYYTQLAVSYEESGETAKAIQAYKIAYKETKNKVLLYHLARNYDKYYKDKNVALSYYQRYLEEKDTANEYLMNYSKHRIQELKASVHFKTDSF